MESLAAQAYRADLMTAEQIRRSLGYSNRMRVDEFLRQHEICDYTLEDFGQDRETLANFGNRSAEPYTGGLEDLQPGPARRSFVVAAQCGSRRLFRELLADHRLSKRSIDNLYSLNGRN